jgi:hypothetical protein
VVVVVVVGGLLLLFVGERWSVRLLGEDEGKVERSRRARVCESFEREKVKTAQSGMNFWVVGVPACMGLDWI